MIDANLISAIANGAQAANETAKKAAAKPAKVASKPAAKAASKPAKTPAKASAGKPASKAKPQAAKPAEPAKSAGKTTRKAAPKTEKPAVATKAVAFIARTAQPGKTVHVLSEETRPVSGKLLFAHTHAALTVLGLLGGADTPKKSALTIMGQRAVSYHLKQGNFEAAPNNAIRLTTLGGNFFKNRYIDGKIDVTLANGFTELFLDGKIDKALGVKASNVYEAGLGH